MNISEAIDRVRPTIVQISFTAIFSKDEKLRRKRPLIHRNLGTGFFINSDGYVISAYHVINAGQKIMRDFQAERKELTIGIPLPNTETMRENMTEVPFNIVDNDERHDLSLIRLSKNPFKGEVSTGFKVKGSEISLQVDVPRLNQKRPKDGAGIGISGYPFGRSLLVTNAGYVASSWATDIQDIIKPEAPEFRYPDISDIYLGDVEVNPGNSGGPVYLTEDASVVGLCSASRQAPIWDQYGKNANINGTKLFYHSGLTIIRPSKYIIELLERNNLSWSAI